MIAGAIAFFIYALIVSQVMMRYKPPALVATSTLMLVWLATAFGLWFVWVR
jgi:Trk-type K+ transport system membrane component